MNVVSVVTLNYYTKTMYCTVMQCVLKREVPNILRENWIEYNTRMKPIMKTMKEDFKKEVEQGVLLEGLKDLINSNTESISILISSNTSALTSVLATKKTEASLSPSNDSSSSPSRTAKLTKPTKVPSWTKDMSLETYVKQLTTWQDINEDVPDYTKYHE